MFWINKFVTMTGMDEAWRRILQDVARENALARENKLTEQERWAKIKATLEIPELRDRLRRKHD